MNLDSIRLSLIENEPEIKPAADHLNDQQIIAVDTESNSLYVYHEKVCLIQASSRTAHFVFDTLALPLLPQLAPIFASAEIEKVFHAAEYDILCMKRDLGYSFAHIFDTMVAAKILGRKAIGLAALVEAELGITVEKKFQKANWGIRPLPEEMLAYAAHDTSYLIPLKEKLEKELSEKGLLLIAQEDFNRLCDCPAGCFEPEVTNWWNVGASQAELTAAQICILQNLCEWREGIAKKKDQPPFKILQNKTLIALASEQPRTIEALRTFSGMRKSLLPRYGADLLRILRSEGKNGKCPQPVRKPLPAADVLKRRDAIRNWRKESGIKHGVPSDVILPKDIMEQIIQKNPKNEQQLHRIMEGVPWRFKRFSNELMTILRNLSQ